MMKSVEELKLSDDFMFKEVVTRNLNIAKRIIELALGEKVEQIRLMGTEVEKQGSYLTKKTRFDALLHGNNKWIVIEMQTTKNDNIPLRVRTYHIHLVEEDMKVHKDYEDMQETIVIFLCMEDYYGYHKPIYTFISKEKDINELIFEEKRTTIFLNPDSNSGNEDVKAFLTYLKEGAVTDEFTQEIDDTIEHIKEDQDFRGSYMTFGEKLQDSRKEGVQEGIQKGIQEAEIEM